jgi:hypothetical protein
MGKKEYVFSLVTIICLVSSSAIIWAGARNLVNNPSFEIIENGKPIGWGIPANNCEIITDSALAYEGQTCIKTLDGDGTERLVINQAPIPNFVYSPKNPRFRFRVRYRTEGELIAAPMVALEFFQYKDGSYTKAGDPQARSGSTNTNGSWETIEFEFNVPANTNQVWLNLRNFNTKGAIFWDGVEVKWINSDRAFEVNAPQSALRGGQIPVTIKALDWNGNVISNYNNQVRFALVDPDGNILPGMCSPEVVDGFVGGTVTTMVTIPESAPEYFMIKVIDTEEETLTGVSLPLQTAKRNQEGDLVGSRNMLANGNFEFPDPIKPLEKIYLWGGDGYTEGQGTRHLITDPALAYQGSRLAKTVTQTSADRVAYVLQPIPAVGGIAGRDVKIKYHYRGENLADPGGRTRVELFGINEKGYYYSTPAIVTYTKTGTHDGWQTLEIPCTVPQDTVMMSTDFGIWYTSGTMYWDAAELVWANSQEAFRLWHPGRITWGEDLSVLIEALDWNGQVIPGYFNTVKFVLTDEQGNPLPTEAYTPAKAEGFVDGRLQVTIHIDPVLLSSIPQTITVKVIDAEESTLTAVGGPIEIIHESSATVGTGSRNYLPNPSFEQLSSTGKVLDWTGYGQVDGEQEFVVNPALAYDGSVVCKTANSNFGDRAVFSKQPVPGMEGASGHEFRARIYYRTENLASSNDNGASVRMEFFGKDAEGKYYYTDKLLYYTTLGTSSQWQVMEFPFVVPADTVRIGIDYGVWENNKGTIWWDLAQIHWINSDQAFGLAVPAQSNSLTLPVTVRALNHAGAILTNYTNTVTLRLFDEQGRELPENAFSPNQYTFQSSQGGVAEIPITLSLAALAALPQSVTVMVVDNEEPSLTAMSDPILMVKEGQLTQPVPQERLVKVEGQLALSFQVKDQYDKLMPSEKVKIVIQSGPGSLSQSEVITDESGQAEVAFHAAGAGVSIVQASLPDFPQSQTVSITIHTVEEYIETQLPLQFYAGQLIQGKFSLLTAAGQPVPQRTLQFSTPQGLIITSESGVTDETGSVNVEVQAPTLVGEYKFQVTVVETGYEQEFQIQVGPAEAAQVNIQCSAPQEPPKLGISTDVLASVTDSFGNLVADGTAVSFLTSDGQEIAENTVQGQVSASFLFSIEEALWIEASVNQVSNRFDLQLPGLQLLKPVSEELVTDEIDFSWLGEATSYRLQASQDEKFANISLSEDLETNSCKVESGLPEGKLFWRVMARNPQVWMTSPKASFTLIKVKDSKLLLPFAGPEVLRLDSTSPQISIPLVLSQDSRATVSIYDANGVEKMRLLDNVFLPSQEDGKSVVYTAQWAGKDRTGRQLNNGIYYCLIRVRSTDGKSGKVVRRIVVVR